MKTKTIYINWRSQYGLETVDECGDRKTARYLVAEYNLAYGGGCYISQRCTNDWKAK